MILIPVWGKSNPKFSLRFKEKNFKKAGYLFPIRVLTQKLHHKKHKQMKKLLIVLAIGTFAACSSGTTETTTEDTSTVVAPDTTTTMAPDTTTMAPADTTHADSTAH